MATRNGLERGPDYRNVAVWPLVLIAAGVVLFAANFGWLRWDALWSVGYLWPLVLVAVGVDVLLGGRHRLLVVLGTLVAAVVIYSATAGSLGFGAAAPTPETVSQGLEGATSAEVSVSTGVAQLQVRSEAGAELLAEGTVVPQRGERIERSFDVTRGVARFSLGSEGQIRSFPGNRTGRWELTLTGRVPLALAVDTGVGEAVLDLSELQLARLDVNTGVGASTITLPPRGDYVASVDTGVGAATIRIPDGVAARITVSRGIGAVSVPSGFDRQGDVYESEGFGTARDRVELHVDSGVGAVDIVRTR